MSEPNGICLSVDYQVTRSDNGQVVDPYAVKFLTVQYPPIENGTQAIFAYAGLAQVWGNMPVGEWLRRTLRGESEPPDVSMSHLLDRLNQRLTRFRAPLVINVLAVENEGKRRLLGGFSNTADFLTAEKQFDYEMSEIGTDFWFSTGSGASIVSSKGHRQVLDTYVKGDTHSAEDSMNLLAAINREVANDDKDKRVSPYCHATYIGKDTNWKPTSRTFQNAGESVPFNAPIIVSGIDLTYMAEQMMAAGMAGQPPVLDPDRLQQETKRRL